MLEKMGMEGRRKRWLRRCWKKMWVILERQVVIVGKVYKVRKVGNMGNVVKVRQGG